MALPLTGGRKGRCWAQNDTLFAEEKQHTDISLEPFSRVLCAHLSNEQTQESAATGGASPPPPSQAQGPLSNMGHFTLPLTVQHRQQQNGVVNASQSRERPTKGADKGEYTFKVYHGHYFCVYL